MPTYVSTVDSGNLAGYLLTLKQGLSGLLERESLIDQRALDGIADAILLFEEALEAASGPAAASLARELVDLRDTLATSPETLAAWPAMLERIDDQLAAIGVLFHELEDAAPADQAHRLADAAPLARSCRGRARPAAGGLAAVRPVGARGQCRRRADATRADGQPRRRWCSG